MYRSKRSVLIAACALGIDLVCGGSQAPAFAQSSIAAPALTADPLAGPPQEDTTTGAAPTADAQAIAPNPADTTPAPGEPSAEGARADGVPLDTPPDETSSGTIATAGADTARAESPADEPGSADAASAVDRQAATQEAAAVETRADPPGAEVPPVGPPSGIAAQLARWVAATGDNGGLPFVIVDKLAADVFVFAPDGSLLGAAPVLVGETPGDDSAEGVGDRDLGAISPEERTTPAGRFVASFGPASGHRTVLWVDYATAISLHPVITTNRAEHRLERLRSPAPEDHRITYGCINVPTNFYRAVVLQAFGGGEGVVYILPEAKPLQDVFPAFAVVAQASATTIDARSRDAPQSIAPVESLPVASPPPPNDVLQTGSESEPDPSRSAQLDAARTADPQTR